MKFVSYPELAARFGIPFSLSHLWRLEKGGQFPKRVSLTRGTILWLEADVIAWMTARADARGADAQPVAAA